MFHSHSARVEEYQDDDEPKPGRGLTPLSDQEPHLLLLAPEFLVEDPSLAEALVSLLKSEDTEAGLLRAVTKCVAKLSHGASGLASHSLMAAVPRLVQLAETSSKPEVGDNSLGTLINLSQLASFRPGLGAAGVVELLVRRHNTGAREDSRVEGDSVVRSLCLYCRYVLDTRLLVDKDKPTNLVMNLV